VDRGGLISITIYGAGAIGGLIGAYFARAGEDVRFVDRMAEHVEVMNRQGLRITGAAEFTVPTRACLPAELRGPLGLTFLAVKSQDTDAALDVLAPLAGPETVLVSLQNGMNPPRIGARLGASLNEHLVRQVEEIEAGARSRGLANLDELEQHQRPIDGDEIGAHA
jgi:2-dehydropantoate 2-reductase